MLQAITVVPPEVAQIYNPVLQELFYIIIGLIFMANGIKAFKDTATAKHNITGIFWCVMGAIFIIGPYIPA